MSDFVEAALVEDVPNDGKLCLEIDGRYIVIARVEGEYYCLDDVCTHDGGTLGDGELEGYCLTCPRHGAQFDVRSGDAVTMPATEPTAKHEVRIEENRILVRLSE
jgi:3-phenylpropionate/trans-cinnamate dioxygenase ferredoxin subunit